MQRTDPAAAWSAPHGSAAVRWSARALLGVLWVSIGAFGTAILATYVRHAVQGHAERWNGRFLPGLFDPDRVLATLGIGMHFATAAALMLLIPLQLITPLRRRYPAVHRWSGRVAVTAALLTGAGGLTFILAKGTIGGLPMSIGFGLYGTLMALASFNTFRFARARDWVRHRAWAIRLFALVISSWLFRVEYAGWSIATNGLGRTKTFDGPFDVFMAYFFYVGALAVAEIYLRIRRGNARPLANAQSAALLFATAGVVAVLTYFLILYDWGPGIRSIFEGFPST